MSVKYRVNPTPSSRKLTTSLWVNYGGAAISVGLATLLRLFMTRFLGPTAVPFITYFPAVVFCAWVGGRGPALLCVMLSLLVADYLFFLPAFSLTLSTPTDAWSLAAFLLAGLGIAAIGGAQHQAQMRTKASQELLATILGSIGDAVIATNVDGQITFMNPVAETITGWQQEQALGKDVKEVFALLTTAMHDAAESPVEKILREGKVVELTNHLLLLDKAGGEISIDYTAAPIYKENGEISGMVMAFQDSTGRKRLEDQLLQAQKLESVGRLAGGVAHDFNNWLTVILGYTELAQDEYELDATGQGYLANVKMAAEKASHLTGQLLAFARKQFIEPKVVNLNDLVLNLDKMLRRLIGENIELVMLPEDNLHSVRVDPGQFEQIVVNLVVNARDAMPRGGKITLETDNVLLDEEYASQHEEVVPGEYVLLAISDTGSGMDESIRLHIFEPFFTTKEKGRGTGLGLATVYGIVKQAGGHIWLYSEVEKGTTFKIYLPRTTEADQGQAPRPQIAPLGGSELILLVEDETAVRMLALHTLQRQGYRVLEAMNGEEALRVAQGQEHEIDLLITDVIMPQMSGKELADRLQGLHPGLKVLYASGYTENTIVHHGVLEQGVTFLAKPFTSTVLARRVRETLDNAPTISS